MFTLIENLLFLIVNFLLIYACYYVVHFIGMMGIEWVGPYILLLKIYIYLPTFVKNRIQNLKPCCFSFDKQYKLQHAIQNNHLNCLKIAYKNGCEWSSNVCKVLGLLNHKECLLYAHENRCEWDFCTCDEVDYNIKTCVENGLNLIQNSLELLKDRQEPDLCDHLAVENKKSCLLFAHINGQEWDLCTCDEKNGDKRKCVENGLYKIHVLPNLVA
jgi:hypothetical protein